MAEDTAFYKHSLATDTKPYVQISHETKADVLRWFSTRKRHLLDEDMNILPQKQHQLPQLWSGLLEGSQWPVLKEFMVCILLVLVVMATNWFYIKPEASGLVMEYIPPSESKPCWKGSNHTVMEINYKLWTAQGWNKQLFWNHISPPPTYFGW